MQAKFKKPPVQKDDSSVIQMFGTYLPYWPLFLIFLILSLTGAFLFLRYSIPKYEASATMIIKDEKKGNDDSKFVESLDLINSKKIIENEVEVLQSRSLMNSVVKKLHLYAPISQEGKINTISAYQICPLTIEAYNPDSINETLKVDFDFDLKKGTVVLNKTFTGPINEWLHTPFGVLKFLPNPKYIASTNNKPFFFSLYNCLSVTAGITSGLKVAPSGKLSSVIDLSFTDEVPQRAEDILNELIVAYGNAALTEKNTLAKNTLTFIEARLSIISKDLDSIEHKLQQYKAGTGAVDIGRQGQLYLENVSANDRRLSEINMQLGAMDQLQNAASSPDNVGMLPSTLGINDPTLTQQMNSLSQLQMQYDKLKPTVAENNPLLQSVVEQINRVKPTIISNIKSQRQNLEKNRNSLYATGGGYTSALTAIPQKERQLVEITRDQNIKNGIYQFLLQKREESELSYDSTISDSKVVNNAMASPFPVSPKRLMIFLVAIAIGLGFPILIVTAKEALSPKILYRTEIEGLTNIPIVGEVSFGPGNEGLVVEKGRRTVIAEEFRKLRVSLLSLGINADSKKILITSSISGEGKSFIAANLATSISLTGKKVVLVDMDLHNPGLGKLFGIKEQQGVSEYLIGEKNIDQIIYKISGSENLFYISSGNLQQDSSELLENGKVQQLIKKLDQDFDVVVIDAAPVLLITDAYLLSSLCDATLYVVRHKFTPKMLIKRIDDNMNVNPIKNPAIVFNGVKTRGFFKNNYGYGYNYVYSYDNKKQKSKNIFSSKN